MIVALVRSLIDRAKARRLQWLYEHALDDVDERPWSVEEAEALQRLLDEDLAKDLERRGVGA
jgi:hypothetical protein